MRMIKPPGVIEGGTVKLDGTSLGALSDAELRNVRLADIAVVPQGAMNSLNPVMRIGDQILDGIRKHRRTNGNGREKLDQTLPELHSRGRPAAERAPPLSARAQRRHEAARLHRHRYLAPTPKVIIADEPTSALDVVVQRQIMQTLNAVQKRLQASILLVGHDMGLMAKFVDRIGVMYGGKLVELGTVYDIFQQPLHPYTQLLISSLPTLEAREAAHGIPGTPPSLLHPPSGCVFHPRCPFVMPRCSEEFPQDREPQPDHTVACHLYD